MSFDFLSQSSIVVAPRLLGCIVEREIDGQLLRGRIVETEAYDQSDEASHSFRGQTPRTQVMFGPAGYLYVYFTYGMHYCANVVTGGVGEGSAVLIRAIEPLEGSEVMAIRRGGRSGPLLTNGPAKFCQALGIDTSLNGHNLRSRPLRLVMQPALWPSAIVTTTRIGISRAKDAPWRFYEAGNSYVSKR